MMQGCDYERPMPRIMQGEPPFHSMCDPATCSTLRFQLLDELRRRVGKLSFVEPLAEAMALLLPLLDAARTDIAAAEYDGRAAQRRQLPNR